MREIDLVLDFAVNLGDRMLDSGANLERVNTSIHRILHTYGFQEISLFSLSIRKSHSGLGSMKSRLSVPVNNTVRSET